MPKIRTNKTAAKRFKISGTGKITRRKSHNNHQFLHKSAAQKRRLELEPTVFQGEQKRMRRLLVLGQVKEKAPSDVPAAKAARLERQQADRATLVALVK